MMVLGLLLLLAAAGLTLNVVLQNTASMTVDAVGQTFTLDSGWLFVAGVATGAIGLLGLTMLIGGMARAGGRRAGRAQSTSAIRGLEADRDRLADELHRERADRPSTTASPRSEPSRRAARDDEIDLASEEPRAESNRSRRDGVRDDEESERGAADRREPVGSGRHGLFRRRDH